MVIFHYKYEVFEREVLMIKTQLAESLLVVANVIPGVSGVRCTLGIFNRMMDAISESLKRKS